MMHVNEGTRHIWLGDWLLRLRQALVGHMIGLNACCKFQSHAGVPSVSMQ